MTRNISTKPTPGDIAKVVSQVVKNCPRCKHYTYETASRGDSCPDCEREIEERFQALLNKVQKQQKNLPVKKRL